MGFLGAGAIATGCIMTGCLLSWVALYEVVICHSPVQVQLMPWMDLEPLTVAWSFTYDDATTIMCCVVLTVSSMVHLFSLDYMASDPHGQRFMSLLSFFTASMCLLVTGDSLVVLFVGWELIGVSSFLLIGFWLTRAQAVKAAVKAITVNRVGDTALTFGFIIVLAAYGSLDFPTVFAASPYVNEGVLSVATLCMLLGGMAKSAQLPFHSWLADMSTYLELRACPYLLHYPLGHLYPTFSWVSVLVIPIHYYW